MKDVLPAEKVAKKTGNISEANVSVAGAACDMSCNVLTIFHPKHLSKFVRLG